MRFNCWTEIKSIGRMDPNLLKVFEAVYEDRNLLLAAKPRMRFSGRVWFTVVRKRSLGMVVFPSDQTNTICRGCRWILIWLGCRRNKGKPLD